MSGGSTLTWYYEQMTMTGTWSPVLTSAKPDYQVKAGKARLRGLTGWSPRVRAIQPVPANLQGMTLSALQALLTSEQIEVAA